MGYDARETTGRGGPIVPHPRTHCPNRETANVRVALFITCFNDTLFPETEVDLALGHARSTSE